MVTVTLAATDLGLRKVRSMGGVWRLKIRQVLLSPPLAPISQPKTVYVVKSGDTLSHIARRYHTSVKQLMSWNHLHSDRLSIGQKIYIY